MAVDLSKISTEDLQALKAGNLAIVSTGTLQYLKSPDTYQPKPVSDTTKLESVGRGGAQGVTFGFGDELSAGLAAGVGQLTGASQPGETFSDQYTRIRDRIRGENVEAQEANPGSYLAGQVGGGLLTAAPIAAPGAAVTAGGGLLARGAGAAARMSPKGQIGLAGAEGALAGAGQAKELEDVAREAALGGVLGAGFAKTGQAAFKGAKKFYERGIAKDVSKFDEKQSASLVRKAKRLGIDVTAAEATGLKSLMNKQWALRNMEPSDDIIEDFLTTRQKQVRTGVYKYLDSLAKPAAPEQAFAGGIEAAEQGVKKLKDLRKDATEGLYAGSKSGAFDATSITELAGEAGAGAPGKIGSALKKYSKQAEDIEDVRGAQMLKLELQDEINKAFQGGQGNKGNELKKVLDGLQEELRAQSPQFKEADRVFAEMSAPVTEAQNTLAGRAIKEASKAATAPNLGKKLFASTSSPNAVKQSKKLIESHSPEAWNGVVRGHIQKTLEDMMNSATGDVKNLGGALQKNILGSKSKQNMMRAALEPAQYKGLQDLMEVLQATGKSSQGQSITAPLMKNIEQMEREALGPKAALASFATAPLRTLKEMIQGRATGRYAEGLAKTLTDQKSLGNLRAAIKQLRQIPPGFARKAEATAIIAGLIAGREINE